MLGVRLDIGAVSRGTDPAARAGFVRTPDIYANFTLGDFRNGGMHHAGKTPWLAATGGIESGGTTTFGPVAVGPELISNGAFGANVSGWAVAGGLMTSVLSWQAPGLIRNTSPTAGQQRFGQAQTRVIDRVYRARVAVVRAVGSPQLSENVPAGSIAIGPLMTNGATGEMTWAEASGGSRTLGINTSFSAADHEEYDDFSLTEVRPFAGFDAAAWAFMVRGVAPGALPASEQAIFAADADSPGKVTGLDRDRVRLAWAPNGDIKLIVTRHNVEQANLTLGQVAAGAVFRVRVAIAANAVSAGLNDAAPVTDTTVAPPGLAYVRLGRSRAGEAFGGVIEEAGLWFGPQSFV